MASDLQRYDWPGWLSCWVFVLVDQAAEDLAVPYSRRRQLTGVSSFVAAGDSGSTTCGTSVRQPQHEQGLGDRLDPSADQAQRLPRHVSAEVRHR
jgi:hypothetical protein